MYKADGVFRALAWVAALGCAMASADTYTYPDLVRRTYDLSQLAILPPDGEKTCLASSYDRRSKYDAATDKYIAWDANDDGTGFVRTEGDSQVLMDVQGPGCVWRTWSATAGKGHVKMYFDGSATPAVDLPFSGYFDGKTAPFDRPNLVYVPSKPARGYDNYTPIPFAKSCKIVAEKGWGQYYHFNYTTFPPGTVVPTFKMDLSAEDAKALNTANERLSRATSLTVDQKSDGAQVTVAAGRAADVVDLRGEGQITELGVSLELPKDVDSGRDLLRRLAVRITWDDATSPAVWSPLGDFFGFVNGADSFNSLPVEVTVEPDARPYITLKSRWSMPYASRAHVEVVNDGDAPVTTHWSVAHGPVATPIAQLGRFHAKWHRDAFLPTRPDRAIDWTLLTTKGRGRFVGTHLHGWNPRGTWWGEGDEKFFVDGEKFPSTFGTGSEDYFGYAWGTDGHFARPFHNQILNEKNAGHFVNNRWHISDSVPFTTSFEGSIEKYYPNKKPTLYAATVYWYLSADGVDPYGPVPVADRVGYWVRPAVFHEPGAIEPSTLRPDLNQDMTPFGDGWSGDRQLLWRAKQPGDAVDLKLPSRKPGKYRVVIRHTVAPDYGVFQAAVNGVDVGPAVDGYGPAVKVGAETDLGVVDLPDGVSTLRLTVTGKSEKSKGLLLGLDYVKLIAG